MCAGGKSKDTAWVFDQLLNFAEVVDEGRKPKFFYRLPKVGQVCRGAWVQAAGFINPNNGRVRKLEARIRRGDVEPPKLKSTAVKTAKGVTNKTLYAKSFLSDYALTHSQRSPVASSL